MSADVHTGHCFLTILFGFSAILAHRLDSSAKKLAPCRIGCTLFPECLRIFRGDNGETTCVAFLPGPPWARVAVSEIQKRVRTVFVVGVMVGCVRNIRIVGGRIMTAWGQAFRVMRPVA
jgi:hypothetical protein